MSERLGESLDGDILTSYPPNGSSSMILMGAVLLSLIIIFCSILVWLSLSVSYLNKKLDSYRLETSTVRCCASYTNVQ